MTEPSESPGRWGTARPGRRDVLRGAAAVGAFLAADVAALLIANNWIGPPRLTPQVFLDGFAKVFGRHPGFRKNHAKGVAVAGWFDSNGNGQRVVERRRCSRPAARRCSVGSRWPAATRTPLTRPRRCAGSAWRSDSRASQQWRMATLNLPVFLDNSPQSFYDRLIASAVVPGTGKPDPTAMARFLAAHPETARAMAIVKQHPPTPGFADSVYSGLNAFYFVNESGVRVPVRWSLTPLQQALPPASGPNALFDRAGPAVAGRPAALASGADRRRSDGSDARRDAAVARRSPHRRRRAAHARTRSQTDADGNARDINFDPLVLPAGIEPSDDPLLSARSAVYAASYRRRTGEQPRCDRARPSPSRYTRLTRVLHWLTAALVFCRPVHRFRHGQLGQPIRRAGHAAQDAGRDHPGGDAGCAWSIG